MLAVAVGAVLATAGGFAATQLEAAVRRRERERSAALMFGEILSALQTLAEVARETRLRGDPYGPFTMRLIRAAVRETETYERNRTALYDLHNAEIRIRIHVLMVQVGLALEGVSETSSQIAAVQAMLEEQTPSDDRLATLQARQNSLLEARESAFDFVLTAATEITSLVAALQPIAKVNFEDLKRFSGNPFSA